MNTGTAFSFCDRFDDIVMLGDGIIPAFLYRGTPPVLFDPGVSAYGPFYLRQLQAHLDTTDSLIIALTHSHFDHAGAAPYLRRKVPGMRLAASRKAADILQRTSAVKRIQSLNEEYEQELASAIEGEPVAFEALKTDIVLSDGESIPLGNGRRIEVLYTPGHTNDCLSFFFPHCGALIAGEAAGVIERDFIHSPFCTGYDVYRNSLQRLQAVRPRALCIAHNGILTGSDTQRFLEKSADAASCYKDMIERCLDECSDIDRVVQHITELEYDAEPLHTQKRQPFILNLEAKVKAVAKMRPQRCRSRA